MINKITELKEKFSIWDKKQNWNRYAGWLGNFWIIFIGAMLLLYILSQLGILPPIVK